MIQNPKRWGEARGGSSTTKPSDLFIFLKKPPILLAQQGNTELVVWFFSDDDDNEDLFWQMVLSGRVRLGGFFCFCFFVFFFTDYRPPPTEVGAELNTAFPEGNFFN